MPATGFALYVRNILDHLAESRETRQNIHIHTERVDRENVRIGQMLCDKLSELGFSVRMSFDPLAQDAYDNFGLVIEVDKGKFEDGYKVLHSQKIGKPLLMNLFGEFNER